MYVFSIIVLVIVLLSIMFSIQTRRRNKAKAKHTRQLDNSWFPSNKDSLTPEPYQRAGDQTFLTYPEWFLVFSPAEQAIHFKTYTSTQFPYETHVQQFWDSYEALSIEIAQEFDYNKDYHTMVNIIGYSTMIEYRAKLIYEQTIGSITNLVPSKMTAEDRFYADFMQRYVDFIQKEPWYKYSFLTELKNFWFKTSFLEWNLLRKLERRIFITIELLFKAFYGWGLGIAAGEGQAEVTAVVVEDLPSDIKSKLLELAIIESLDSNKTLITLPRYAAFNSAVTHLVKSGAKIKEIAGNTSAILLTIVVNKNWTELDGQTKVIFKQNIATDITKERVALVTMVKDLGTVILSLEQAQIPIEHIFDY